MMTPVARARVTRVLIAAALVAATAGVLGVPGQTAAPRFYPDDPIAREPESQDASKAKVYQIEQMYEMVRNLFVTPDYKPSGARAANINTIDEVPDSSWFTNRVGSKPITIEELVKGPMEGAPPDPSHWVLTREKTTGAHPGFTARDAKGEPGSSSSIRPTSPRAPPAPSKWRRKSSGASDTTRWKAFSPRSIRRRRPSIRKRPCAGHRASGHPSDRMT